MMNRAVFAVHAGKIVPVTAPEIVDGVLLVKDGKILSLGKYGEVLLPEDCPVLEYPDAVLYPGLIDSASHVGIDAEPYSFYDGNRDGEDPSDIISPLLKAVDGINPLDKTMPKVRSYGFTTCFAALGHTGLVEGFGCAVKMTETFDPAEMILQDTEALNMTFGDFAVSMAKQMKKPPMSRPAMMQMLRDTFDAAKKAAESEEEEKKASAQTKALIPVIRREKKVRLYVCSVQDMVQAVRFAESYDLDYVLDGCNEAFKIPDFLAEHKARVCLFGVPFGPMQTQIAGAFDMDFHTAGKLEKAGCLKALSMDDVTNTTRLPMTTGLLTAYGLSHEGALRAMTIGGAEVLGIQDRTGSLEPGKDADFTVWNGDVLDNFSRCLLTAVDGKIVYERK